MPKDGYVCPLTFGIGIASLAMKRHRRAAFNRGEAARARSSSTLEPATALPGRSRSAGAPSAGSITLTAEPAPPDFGLAGMSVFEYKEPRADRSRQPPVHEEETWVRPRRPYVTTLAGVTINRSGESAVISYGDPAVSSGGLAIGPDRPMQ